MPIMTRILGGFSFSAQT